MAGWGSRSSDGWNRRDIRDSELSSRETPAARSGSGPDGGLPIVYRVEIRPEWIDRNGHFNAGYYMVVLDTAIGPWFDLLGIDTEHRAREGVSTFTVESHTTYLSELREGEAVAVTAQLLAFTDKKVHTFLRMLRDRDGTLAATNEVLSLHIDLKTRRPAPMHPAISTRMTEVFELHRDHPLPSQAGRVIGVEAKSPERT